MKTKLWNKKKKPISAEKINITTHSLINEHEQEKLINNQEEETKKLLKYCELEWDVNCLSPHKNEKLVATASLAQVRSPIYKSSIKKWQNYSNNLKDLESIINN